jgi:tetratricopeptide (TPR) repeat protein
MGTPSKRRRVRSAVAPATPAVQPPSRTDTLGVAGGACLIVGLVAAVFWQTGWFTILNFDDDQYLDAVIRQGLTWHGFVRAWTESQVGQWHPLTTLSFMVDAQVFGTWWGGYHLHNAVLHAAASVVLFAALVRLTGATGRSLVAAAVFAIHPLRAESVAWITERKDVLSGLFLATTFWTYAFYVEKPASWRRYALLLLSFAAGLLSKSMLVTLPVGLLILDWWPLRRVPDVMDREGWRQLRGLVIEKLPLVALAVGSIVATFLSQAEVVRPIETLPFAVRASSSVVAYATYVLQLFWPIGLAPHYPYSSVGPTNTQVAASALFVAAITAVAWCGRRVWPSFTAGWAWYIVTLLPVVGFVTGGIQLIADRYTYVSQIWLVVGIVWGLDELAKRMRAAPWCRLGAASVGLVALAWGCWMQTRVWKESETLWRYTLSVTDDNAYAHSLLAAALMEKGKSVEAAEQNRKALAIESDNILALANLGTLLLNTNATAEAIAHYERALEVNPRFALGWYNLGAALAKKGRINDAERAWQTAVEIEPGMAIAWHKLAGLFLERQDFDAAIAAGERAVASGGGPQAAFILGQALDRAGRTEDAVQAYRTAVTAESDAAVMLNNLGSVLERTGRLDEAAAIFRRAIAREPGAPVLEFNLGIVLAKQGLRTEAITVLTSAQEGFRKANNAAMVAAATQQLEKLKTHEEAREKP